MSGNIVAATGAAWTATTATLTQPRRRLVAAVVNGYLYVIAGHNAVDTTGGMTNGTTYGDIQIAKIDMSTGGTGDISGDASHLFTKTSTGALTPRWDASLAVGAGFIFVTGGCTASPGDPTGLNNFPPGSCDLNSTTNESFVVYNANGLGVNTWNNTAHTYVSDLSLANRVGAASVAYNGYLYVAGGCTTYTMASTTCGAATTEFEYAPINADGSLGTWLAAPSPLSALYAFSQLVALNGTLYILTGENGSGVAKSIVRYTAIGASGAPGAWHDATNSLPVTLTKASAVVYANRIYVAGGWDGTTLSNKVYVSPPLPNGGDITVTRTCPDTSVASWCATTTGFTTARRELSLASAGAYLYVVGGFDGTNYYSDVQVATPNTSTGDITSWTKNEEIPYVEGGLSAVGANGYVFVFGGRNGVATTSCSANIYSAAVNGDGTLGHWQQAPNSLTEARFGMATNYYNGYFFTSGGHNCTSISSTNPIKQSGQLSEAIHSTYTRYIDFGTNATFRQLYVLGTNAAISGTDIDLWKLYVKTSTTANNSWGTPYTTSLTGLGTGPAYGTAITFQALNGSGVDQGAAQYWTVKFDIDQAQSFNFPDGNQPQITKYDLYFSPGPAKRLRDGKTFVNEIQTNLDAHP